MQHFCKQMKNFLLDFAAIYSPKLLSFQNLIEFLLRPKAAAELRAVIRTLSCILSVADR